jgi:acyl-CoA thioesterase-1
MRALYAILLLSLCIAGPLLAGSVLCVGDSLTAGYGLSKDEAYPAQLAARLRAAGHSNDVINAGVSGDTTAGGLRRIDWLLRQPVDVLVLALGANDGLRGLSPEAAETNLTQLIERVRAKYPAARVLLCGMQAPPNMGPDYAARLEAVYPRLARATGATLLPFLLEGVAGVPALNQADGIHPTAEGQRVIADAVWAKLEPLLAVTPPR